MLQCIWAFPVCGRGGEKRTHPAQLTEFILLLSQLFVKTRGSLVKILWILTLCTICSARLTPPTQWQPLVEVNVHAEAAGGTSCTFPQKRIHGQTEAGMKQASFSASSETFKLSVSYIRAAKFINAHFMQSLSSQAQTVWCAEWEGGFCFPARRFYFYFCPRKTRYLKRSC